MAEIEKLNELPPYDIIGSSHIYRDKIICYRLVEYESNVLFKIIISREQAINYVVPYLSKKKRVYHTDVYFEIITDLDTIWRCEQPLHLNYSFSDYAYDVVVREGANCLE